MLFSRTTIDTILSASSQRDDAFYCYFNECIRQQCAMFTAIPYVNKAIHYATMANVHPQFLSIIKEEQCNVFVNSIAHLESVLAAGFTNSEIIFTASALPIETMHQIHNAGAYTFLDSPGQVNQWFSLFPRSPVGLRCNIGELVKPRKTRGGFFIGKESRLGLSIDELTALKNTPHIDGLHCYVGTDIMDVDYFLSCYECLTGLIDLFPGISCLNFGGGFGLDDTLNSEFDIVHYGHKVTDLMNRINQKAGRSIKMILEPGRIIGGSAGFFITTVTDVKIRQQKQYIGVNASTAQFPRPLLYPDSAFHPAIAVKKDGTVSTPDTHSISSKVYGCSTYSRDFLAHDISLPDVNVGDYIIFGHAGSYCSSSHLSFLGFPKCEEVFL